MIIAAIGVILSRNPVHSVLWLIFAFINSAGIFLLLNAEFLAMMMIIVYVGAVAVLFLFVVMMLGAAKTDNLQPSSLVTLFAGGVGCLVLVFNISTIIARSLNNSPLINKLQYAINPDSTLTNTEMIAEVLYSDFLIPFQVAGIILLVAIIGAITLTTNPKSNMKKQNVQKQLDRDKDSSISLVNIKPNTGVQGIDYDI